ncbi:fucose isomerase [Phocaeicola sp.]
MNLYLITFQSNLNKIETLYDCHKDLFVEIEKYFTLHLIHYNEVESIPTDAYKMAFIASGGVEKTVTQQFDLLPYPITLLTDGLQNSLAASLEIATWMRSKGMKARIIHGTTTNMVKQILTHHQAFAAKRELNGKRIGVLGYPSPWLVASNVDYLLAKRRCGIEFVDVPMEEIYCLFYQIKDDDIGYDASIFAGKAVACREGTPEDLLKAMRLYKAVRTICEKKKLDAVTLSCFSLIEKLGTTGCLALSLLNDEGIPAGCEGDLQSIVTMLIAKVLTGQSGFMANPSFINDEQNEIVVAHCTIATKMADQFIIRNHFETETGISIQGILHEGDITIMKCGGECLDEYFVSPGYLIENTNYINACRTQVRIRMGKPVDYFTRNPLGNHHIILMGDHEKVIHEFMQLYSCKQVE